MLQGYKGHSIHVFLGYGVSTSLHVHVILSHVQDGQTALYIASKNGHIRVVNYLLQAVQVDVHICQKVYGIKFSMCSYIMSRVKIIL